MKRDMQLIREIMMAIEADKNSNSIDGYQDDQVKYHQALLIQAKLVDGVVDSNTGNTSKIPTTVIVNDLTWHGHEFLSSVRDHSVWETIKTNFKEDSMETVINVAKQLAEGFAKKKVEALLQCSDTH